MPSLKSNKNGGFVALVSAVIISLVLLTLIVGTGERGFSSRFNILNSELKAMSSGLAEACVETAILKLAENDTYTINPATPEWIPVGDQGCEISSVDPSVNPIVINTHATSSPIVAHTKLEVKIDRPAPFIINSWQEIP